MTATTAEHQAKKRPCPLCAARRSVDVLLLSAAEIVQANWSYRASALSQVDDACANPCSIVRCEACRFVYASCLPSSEFLDRLYDEVIDVSAARMHAHSIPSMAIRMSYLADFLPLIEPDGKVLDFGCGFGPTLALLHSVDGIRPYGFESSKLRTAELRARFGNIFDDPLELECSSPFAGVILDNVLEHLPDPIASVSWLASMCSPGAIAYVSVPDMSDSRLTAQLQLRSSGHQVSMELNPWEHLNYFDLPHLDLVFENAGFMPIKQMNQCSELRTGLRPSRSFTERSKNALATAWRCLRYALRGDAVISPNSRLYRLTKHAAK